MARRNNHLAKFGISHDKYMELKYFCKQYPEKKESLQSLTSIKAINYTGMPHGSDTGNPTEQQAVLREQLMHDIELIEQTAIEANSTIYHEILDNVTQGISYFYLNAPCSKNYFYQIRDKFFVLLSLKK